MSSNDKSKKNAWIEFLRTCNMPGKSMKQRVAQYNKLKRRTFQPTDTGLPLSLTKRMNAQQASAIVTPKKTYFGVHNLDPSSRVVLHEEDVTSVNSKRGWISDNIITGFQSYLVKDLTQRRIVAMDALQMAMLSSTPSLSRSRPHIGHAHLVRYGMLSTDVPSMIIFPFNISNTHWIVLTYEPKPKRWTTWDSLSWDHTMYVNACHARLRRYFDNEDVIGETYNSYVRKGHEMGIPFPRQQDDYSCGLWVCSFLYMIAKGYDRFDTRSKAFDDPRGYAGDIRAFLCDMIRTCNI